VSFKTTNVSVFTKSVDNDSYALYVVNPKNGNPYKNVLVKSQNKSYTTNDSGKVIVLNSSRYNENKIVKIFTNNETYETNLYLESYGRQYVANEDAKREAKINLFSDRY